MIMLSQIDSAVCGRYGIPPTALKGSSQERRVARPRQVAYYLARRLTTNSFPALGLWYGQRHHTTIMHGIRNVERLMAETPLFAVEIATLREQLACAGRSPLEIGARRFAARDAEITADLEQTG